MVTMHHKAKTSRGQQAVVYWGYTRVYGVYQPPGFFDSVYSPQ